jgi:hypothetical protein
MKSLLLLAPPCDSPQKPQPEYVVLLVPQVELLPEMLRNNGLKLPLNLDIFQTKREGKLEIGADLVVIILRKVFDFLHFGKIAEMLDQVVPIIKFCEHPDNFVGKIPKNNGHGDVANTVPEHRRR